MRDEHDEAADRIVRNATMASLTYDIAADRRAAVQVERTAHQAWTDYFGTTQLTHAAAQLGQERARTARLREALERARKMLGPHSLHSDAVGFAIIAAALVDTPSDWLAEHDERVRAWERERCLMAIRDVLFPLPAAGEGNYYAPPGRDIQVAYAWREVEERIRSLGGEGAGRG